MIYRILIPLIFGAVAAAVAFAVKAYWGINDLQTAIVGSATFCILMVLWNYVAGLMFVDRVRKRLAAIVGFENDIMRRLEQIEKNLSTSVETEMVRRRVEMLEARLEAGQERGKPHIGAQLGYLEAAEYDDEKVVPIHGDGRRLQSVRDKNRQSQVERKAKCEHALAEGRLTVRLQPIINLMSQASVAVEAFGHFELPEGGIGAAEVGSELGDASSGKIDLMVLEALSAIVRSMDEEGQTLPVYFGLSFGAFGEDAVWEKIRTRLRADARLSSCVVPQISADVWDKLDEKSQARFLELMEFGLSPCISDCTGLERTIKLVEGKCFKHFKIPAAELLSYTDHEGERVADLLLPRIERRGHKLVVNRVEKSHQLSSLIDLDVYMAQGNIISPPREIKLYSAVPAASGDS